MLWLVLGRCVEELPLHVALLYSLGFVSLYRRLVPYHWLMVPRSPDTAEMTIHVSSGRFLHCPASNQNGKARRVHILPTVTVTQYLALHIVYAPPRRLAALQAEHADCVRYTVGKWAWACVHMEAVPACNTAMLEPCKKPTAKGLCTSSQVPFDSGPCCQEASCVITFLACSETPGRKYVVRGL